MAVQGYVYFRAGICALLSRDICIATRGYVYCYTGIWGIPGRDMCTAVQGYMYSNIIDTEICVPLYRDICS
jgi:hypothetical protein